VKNNFKPQIFEPLFHLLGIGRGAGESLEVCIVCVSDYQSDALGFFLAQVVVGAVVVLSAYWRSTAEQSEQTEQMKHSAKSEIEYCISHIVNLQ
jgi:hypothetical protein